MKALISLLEPRQNGYRVAQVIDDDKIFPVAESLEWVDFPTDFDANKVAYDVYWFDPMTKTIKPNPQDITEG